MSKLQIIILAVVTGGCAESADVAADLQARLQTREEVCTPLAKSDEYTCMQTLAGVGTGQLMIEHVRADEHIATVRGAWLATLAGDTFVGVDFEGRCEYGESPRVCVWEVP